MLIATTFNKEIMETSYILDFGSCIRLEATPEEQNEIILNDFYKSVEWLFSKGFDKYIEIESNTINPCQQNIFTPLRTYRVFKNGHYRTFKIYTKCFGGICITETA